LGRFWEDNAFSALALLTLAESSVYQRVNGAAASRTFWKTALRLCRSGVIVALGELRVCAGGHRSR